jgi:hypothetical protein
MRLQTADCARICARTNEFRRRHGEISRRAVRKNSEVSDFISIVMKCLCSPRCAGEPVSKHSVIEFCDLEAADRESVTCDNDGVIR